MSALRFFANLPEPGELVVSRDEGGARHFLDGRPVYCGSGLFLTNAGTRGELLVRYESAGPIGESSALIFFSDRDSRRVVTREDRFRWPDPKRGAR